MGRSLATYSFVGLVQFVTMLAVLAIVCLGIAPNDKTFKAKAIQG